MELLLNPEEYARLEEIARSRKESMGALIRRAVTREFLKPVLDQRRAALSRLLDREVDLGSWRDAKEAIAKEVVTELEAS